MAAEFDDRGGRGLAGDAGGSDGGAGPVAVGAGPAALGGGVPDTRSVAAGSAMNSAASVASKDNAERARGR
jgi:hypothetical protein